MGNWKKIIWAGVLSALILCSITVPIIYNAVEQRNLESYGVKQTFRLWSTVFSVSMWGDESYIYTSSDWIHENYLAKWDHDGNVIWGRKWGEITGYPQVWSNFEGIFTAGNTWVKIAEYQSKPLIHIIKWTVTGDIEWNNTYEIEDGIVYRLWGDSESLILSAGNSLLRIGFNGTLLWNRTLQMGIKYIYDNDTNIVGLIANPYTSVGPQLLNYDHNGTLVWNSTLPDGFFYYDVAMDGGFIYTSGHTQTPRGPMSSYYHPMIIKWDSQGNQIWNRTGSEFCIYKAIWIENSYIYAVATLGMFHKTILVDKWDLNGYIVSSRTFGRSFSSLAAQDVWSDGSFLFICGTTSERGVFLTEWEL